MPNNSAAATTISLWGNHGSGALACFTFRWQSVGRNLYFSGCIFGCWMFFHTSAIPGEFCCHCPLVNQSAFDRLSAIIDVEQHCRDSGGLHWSTFAVLSIASWWTNKCTCTSSRPSGCITCFWCSCHLTTDFSASKVLVCWWYFSLSSCWDLCILFLSNSELQCTLSLSQVFYFSSFSSGLK